MRTCGHTHILRRAERERERGDGRWEMRDQIGREREPGRQEMDVLTRRTPLYPTAYSSQLVSTRAGRWGLNSFLVGRLPKEISFYWTGGGRGDRRATGGKREEGPQGLGILGLRCDSITIVSATSQPCIHIICI
jgi:hypothetical protein